jgi:hypothetical protein
VGFREFMLGFFVFALAKRSKASDDFGLSIALFTVTEMMR